MLSVGDTSNVDLVTQTADFSGQVRPRKVDILNVDDIPDDNIEGDSSVLIAEQKADPSLALYRKAAEAGRLDVVVHRSILYHIEQVEGQPVCQLCVPEGRRASVLKLAYDSVFGVTLVKGKPGSGSVCFSSGLSCVSLCSTMFDSVLTVSCALGQ